MQSFKEWFSGYEDNFVVIGGAACSILMNERGDDFRATKDIDIVLLIESMNEQFGKRFWEYVIEAGYKYRQKSTGKPQYYRFYKPFTSNFPEMIELFSRQADELLLPNNAVITPIPISEEISSLSAILLDDRYYHFLRDGVRKIDGFPVLDELHMIPFKAKAWLDLTERRRKGESIDRNDINKHRRDIFRLSDMVSGGYKLTLPETLAQDMRAYLTAIRELTSSMPHKEREADRRRIGKITTFLSIGRAVLIWTKQNYSKTVGEGVVVCIYKNVTPIDKNN